jgi:hypothetical protein
MAQFDIYSCKCFSLEDVIEQFEPWGIVNYEWVMIDRNGTPKVISEGVWTPQLEYVEGNS